MLTWNCFNYKFLDKKTTGGAIQIEIMSNQQLAEELYKLIIRNFEKHKLCSSFKDNICGVYLADIQLISKFNRGFRILLCLIDVYGKYLWVTPLKDEKDITIIYVFQQILDGSNRKPNKIWVDRSSKF